MEDQVLKKLKDLHAGHDWACADCGTHSALILEAIEEIESLRISRIELGAELIRLQGAVNNG